MKRFKSARQAQRYLSVHDQIANLFHIPYPEFRHRELPPRLARAFALWREISKSGGHRLTRIRITADLQLDLPFT